MAAGILAQTTLFAGGRDLYNPRLQAYQHRSPPAGESFQHVQELTMAKKTSPSKVSLVVSDTKNPEVALKSGQRLDVVAVNLVSTARPRRPLGARLCGGTSTCLALVDVSTTRR